MVVNLGKFICSFSLMLAPVDLVDLELLSTSFSVFHVACLPSAYFWIIRTLGLSWLDAVSNIIVTSHWSK